MIVGPNEAGYLDLRGVVADCPFPASWGCAKVLKSDNARWRCPLTGATRICFPREEHSNGKIKKGDDDLRDYATEPAFRRHAAYLATQSPHRTIATAFEFPTEEITQKPGSRFCGNYS